MKGECIINYLIIVNKSSSGSDKVSVSDIISTHTTSSDNVTIKYITSTRDYSPNGYDTLIVCGGDGTLNNALNKCNNTSVRHIIYISCGTLNESCKLPRRQIVRANDSYYSYVLACGTLTDIGYTTSTALKKKLGQFAYITKLLSSYRVHNYQCNISTEKTKLNANATLVMLLNNDRCFKLPFNKMYDKSSNQLYLLVLHGYNKDNLINRLKLLLTMTRVFIFGLRKPMSNKHIYFDSCSHCLIDSTNELPWCMDGEKKIIGKDLDVSTTHPYCKLTLINSQNTATQAK